MKKKLILLCGIVLLLITSGVIYKQTVGAPVIGTDKGSLLGIATSGDLRFRVYSTKEYDEYLYCQWEWEGQIYKRMR